MKKKTILVAAIAVMLVAALVVGGTLAYFTDTKSAPNTFTVGNVSINLLEQQRKLDADGNKTTNLEGFQQNQHLYPIVGSAQGEKDALGMPTAKYYVDKMVTIENTGSEKAYIRAYFAIPSALDDGKETFNAGLNVLHFNFGNKVAENGAITSTYDNEWQWKHDGKWNYFETTMADGIKYNVYYADYYQALNAGDTTEQLIQGVYLDQSFDMKADGAYAFGQKLDLGNGWDWSKVSCPVYAVAVQAEGFDSASAAMDAAFGANYNPWGTPATNWQ